jgi:hypothetical protein
VHGWLLGLLTIAILLTQQPQAAAVINCMIRHYTVIQFEAMRSLAIPPAPGRTHQGGRCGLPNNLGGPFLSRLKPNVAMALRCAWFHAAED